MGSVHCVALRGGKRSSEREECVSDRDESRVVVKAAPRAAFEVVEAQLGLHLLVVPLDAPPQLGQAHDPRERCRGGQRR